METLPTDIGTPSSTEQDSPPVIVDTVDVETEWEAALHPMGAAPLAAGPPRPRTPPDSIRFLHYTHTPFEGMYSSRRAAGRALFDPLGNGKDFISGAEQSRGNVQLEKAFHIPEWPSTPTAVRMYLSIFQTSLFILVLNRRQMEPLTETYLERLMAFREHWQSDLNELEDVKNVCRYLANEVIPYEENLSILDSKNHTLMQNGAILVMLAPQTARAYLHYFARQLALYVDEHGTHKKFVANFVNVTTCSAPSIDSAELTDSPLLGQAGHTWALPRRRFIVFVGPSAVRREGRPYFVGYRSTFAHPLFVAVAQAFRVTDLRHSVLEASQAEQDGKSAALYEDSQLAVALLLSVLSARRCACTDDAARLLKEVTRFLGPTPENKDDAEREALWQRLRAGPAFTFNDDHGVICKDEEWLRQVMDGEGGQWESDDSEGDQA